MEIFTFKRIKTALAIVTLGLCGLTAEAQSTFTQQSIYDTIVITPDTLHWDITTPATGAFGTATLTVYYEGDFGASSEFITIVGEGGFVIGVTRPYFDGNDCMVDSVSIQFPASLINAWAADNVINLSGETSDNVDYFCTTNHARVKLTYQYCPVGPVASLSVPPLTLLCAADNSIALNPAPAGGTLSGTGVSGNDFDPSGLAPGTYPVTYIFTNASNCTSDANVVFIVKDALTITGIDTICSINSSTLNVQSVGYTYWYSDIALTNQVGTGNSFTTPNLTSTTTYYASVRVKDSLFIITGLNITDSLTIDHDSITGDDRGGIAVTTNYVYITGDDSTGRYDLNLQNPVALTKADALFSDLANGQLYTLYSPLTGLPNSDNIDSMYVTEIRSLNDDLTLGSISIPLSDSIPFGWDNNYNYNSGIFAGKGFVILYSSPRSKWYVINLQNGAVLSLGSLVNPEFEFSENWSVWGIGEYNGTNYSVLYRNENTNDIYRRTLPSNATSVAFPFSDLSDMASFTYAPWNNRWYLHYEGGSLFNGNNESLTYASASDSTGIETVGAPIEFDCPAAFTITVEPCVGIAEINSSRINVYPNPASESIRIDLRQLNRTNVIINIYDVTGRLVIAQAMNTASAQEINVAGLGNGVYLLQVEGEVNANKTIVVQH